MEKNNSRSDDYTRQGRNGSIKDKIFGKMSEFMGEQELRKKDHRLLLKQ